MGVDRQIWGGNVMARVSMPKFPRGNALPDITPEFLQKMTKRDLQEIVRRQDRTLKKLRYRYQAARDQRENDESYIAILEDALAQEYLEYQRQINKLKGAS